MENVKAIADMATAFGVTRVGLAVSHQLDGLAVRFSAAAAARGSGSCGVFQMTPGHLRTPSLTLTGLDRLYSTGGCRFVLFQGTTLDLVSILETRSKTKLLAAGVAWVLSTERWRLLPSTEFRAATEGWIGIQVSHNKTSAAFRSMLVAAGAQETAQSIATWNAVTALADVITAMFAATVYPHDPAFADGFVSRFRAYQGPGASFPIRFNAAGDSVVPFDVFNLQQGSLFRVGSWGDSTGFSPDPQRAVRWVGGVAPKEPVVRLCASGSFQVDRYTCELCLAGRYAPTSGLPECINCPSGKYSTHAGQAECALEPRNGQCPSSTTVTPLAGFFPITESRYQRCPNRDACPGLDLNLYNQTSLRHLRGLLFACKRPYRGPLCSGCLPNQAKDLLKLTCEHCAPQSVQLSFFFGMFFLSACGVAGIVWYTFHTALEPLNPTVLICNTAIAFIQTQALCLNLDIAWSGYIQEIFGWFRGISSGPSFTGGGLSVGCVIGQLFHDGNHTASKESTSISPVYESAIASVMLCLLMLVPAAAWYNYQWWVGKRDADRQNGRFAEVAMEQVCSGTRI